MVKKEEVLPFGPEEQQKDDNGKPQVIQFIAG